jgi:hypothetical protein
MKPVLVKPRFIPISTIKDILDHLILEVMARFYQELIPIANRQNSFREFYRELCHALMALHETSLAYFSAIAGKIACSEKITKNNKALKNIAMTGEQIHQIIAKRITDAAEKRDWIKCSRRGRHDAVLALPDRLVEKSSQRRMSFTSP